MLVYAPLGGVLLALGFPFLATIGAAVVVVSSTVPNWDRRVPWIRRRGVTHTVWFAGFLGTVLGVTGATTGRWIAGPREAAWLMLFGLAAGVLAVLTHIGTDALTRPGVTPFAPLSDDRYLYEVDRATSTPANYVLLAVGVGALVSAFVVGAVVAG